MAKLDFNKILDKSLEFILSNNPKKYILLLVIIGFILRSLIAITSPFNADEMVHGTHSLGFIESKKLQIMDQDAVWFWLTDFAMKLFGANMFGIRFLAILFGALSIILVYLIAKELFNKKIGLISAFIFTFSSFQLLETRAEMDIPMFFFVMFALYATIIFFKTNKTPYFLITWISLGIAAMIKQIAIIMIPAFLIFYIYYNRKNLKKWKIKQTIYSILILIASVIPILTFNYLLYKDKGILDLQFARFTKIGFETYESIAPTIQPFSLSRLIFGTAERSPGIIEAFSIFYRYEGILLSVLAIIGLFFFYKNRNKFTLLLISLFTFPFIFLAGTSLLSTHFIFGTFFISILSALTIDKTSQLLKEKKNQKILIYSFLALILVFAFVKVQNSGAKGFLGNNEINQLIEFKEQNIDQNSLVVADSRIYRGQIVFSLWDTHYLEAQHFTSFINSPGSQNNTLNINTYFIECVIDDCGWGTIQNQPQFNQTMEAITLFFEQNSALVKTIENRQGQPHFRIYRSSIPLNPSVINFAESTHTWFFYPVAYKPKHEVFDNYQTHNLPDRLLDQFAYLILLIEAFFAILSIPILIYLFYKNS